MKGIRNAGYKACIQISLLSAASSRLVKHMQGFKAQPYPG